MSAKNNKKIIKKTDILTLVDTPCIFGHEVGLLLASIDLYSPVMSILNG